MKPTQMFICCAALGCGAVFISLADELPKLSVSRTNAALTLSWPGLLKTADGSTVRPYFELQHSSDLRLWQPVGERQRVAATAPTPSLGLTLALDQPAVSSACSASHRSPPPSWPLVARKSSAMAPPFN